MTKIVKLSYDSIQVNNKIIDFRRVVCCRVEGYDLGFYVEFSFAGNDTTLSSLTEEEKNIIVEHYKDYLQKRGEK